MTHETGGAMLVGSVACLVLAGIAIYSVDAWGTAHYGRNLGAGFLATAVAAVIGKGMGLGKPIGADRRAARVRARATNALLVVLLVAFLVTMAGNETPTLLGCLAAVAALFVFFSAAAVVRRWS
jgi:hypothetical protein